MKRTSIRLSLSALLLGSWMAALAAEPTSPQTTATYQGMKVAIDPATGRVRPMTREEIQQLRAVVAPSGPMAARRGPANEAAARQTMRTTSTGAVMMQVPNDLMSTVTATQRSDGTVQIHHGDATPPVSQTQEADHE